MGDISATISILYQFITHLCVVEDLSPSEDIVCSIAFLISTKDCLDNAITIVCPRLHTYYIDCFY